MVSHTGAILCPPTAHEHDAVLLNVVPLAGDVRRDDLASGQPHTGGLALARVGFLGLGDADFDADALERGRVDARERRGYGVAGSLGFPAALERGARMTD